MSDLARVVIVIGAVIVVLGILMLALSRIPWMGRLPGDIFIHRGPWRIFIPIVTMLIISLLLTLLLNLGLWLFRRFF